MSSKKIGIALSGGGARGYSHVGVLKALVENGIPIDLVAGTSAGAFVGGAFATGMPIEKIVELGSNVSWFGVAGFSYSPRGLLSNAPMGRFMRANFPVERFEELVVPFAAVTCDLESGDEIVIRDHGDLIDAIRASCAIPGVFVPVINEDGRSLIDGGVTSPMPTAAVRELGAEIVIAVDLLTCGSTYWGKPTTLVGTMFQSAMMMLRTASRNQHYRADVIIEPKIAHIRPDELGKRDELIALGEQAALEKIDDIRRLLQSPQAA